MNIYEAINEVRKEVSYVRKDANVAGRYKAVTHDMVTAVIRPSLIKHGIIIIPTLISSAMEDTGSVSSKGAKFYRYSAFFNIRFTTVDDSSLTIRMESHAIDEGDKAPGKALSYAVKYAILKIFNLETGEDEESRFYEDEVVQAVDVDAEITAIKSAATPEEATRLYKDAIARCSAANDINAAKAIREGVKK